MENKKKRNKAIIISLLVLIVLILVLFLAYKNKDSFGVKTSSVLTKIFNPLETSENLKRELVIAEEYISAGDSVIETGKDGDIRKVKKGSDNSIGKAISNIEAGASGEIEIAEADFNSFWNSFSQFLGNGFKFNQFCSDGKDNDGDGLIDIEDPQCHVGGDLNKEYVPDHYSESVSPFDPDFGIEGVDLTTGIVYPISSPVNTEVELSSIIENRGNENSGQDVNVLFTISDTKEGNSINSLFLLTTIPQINSRDTAIAKVKNTFTSIGNYYIRACADKKDLSDEGSINEAFEDNNCGGWTTFSVTNVLPDTGGRPECSDEKDNDGDGLIDIDDPQCHVGGDLNAEYLPEYDSESKNSTECSDTLDNDNDGLIDEKDPVCHVGGDLNKEYTPNYNSESILSYACNDTLDNDGDKFIDIEDPNCHIDGILSNEYKPTHDSESESPTEDKCLLIEQNPITFTEEEKAKLADLTKKFFLIAPSLQSEESISSVYLDILDQDNFIGQLDTLIKECYAETSSPSYTGPTAKYGNPWYDYDNRGSYLDEKAIADYLYEDPYANRGIEAIQGCTPELSGTEACKPQISDTFGYCRKGKTDPHNKNFNCSNFKTFESCRMYGRGYATGCEWVYTFPIKEYEALLNVW